MDRRRAASFALLVITAAFTLGCSSSAEEKIVKDFFRASRLRDNVTLGNFATAEFDPRTDGIVSDFSVVTLGEEKVTPLPLSQYAKALDEARAADEAFNREKKAFQDANLVAIDRVVRAEQSNKAVSRADQAVQTAWSKWRDDASTHTKAISDAQVRLNNAKAFAELSLSARADAPVDATQYDAEMVVKELTIDANVRAPDGQESKKRLVVELARVQTKGSDPVVGRWIVTEVRDGSGPSS